MSTPILFTSASLSTLTWPSTLRIAFSTTPFACDSSTGLFSSLIPGLLAATCSWMAFIAGSWSVLNTISLWPSTSMSAMIKFITSASAPFLSTACAKIMAVAVSAITSTGDSRSLPSPHMKQ